MAQKIVNLNLNKDNTLTVSVGKSVEHISLQDKTKAQIYDQVKYACISKDVNLSEASLTELIYEATIHFPQAIVSMEGNGRQEVEHNTVTFTECMVEGCTNPARHPLVERGPYKLKCEEHYQAMRKSLVGSNSKGWQTRRKKVAKTTSQWPTEPDKPVVVKSYADRVNELYNAARKADKAIAEYERILGELNGGV